MKHSLLAAAAVYTVFGLPGFQLPAASQPQAAGPAMAAQNEYKAGALVVRQPWTRATPKGAPVAGGYVTITNTGKTADRLTGGSFALAGMVQIHTMSMDNGVMRMRQLENGIEIKPGATISLKPGGMHLMFMRLKGAPVAGKPVKGTLIFQKAGTVTIEFAVGRMGSKQPPAAHKH